MANQTRSSVAFNMVLIKQLYMLTVMQKLSKNILKIKHYILLIPNKANWSC